MRDYSFLFFLFSVFVSRFAKLEHLFKLFFFIEKQKKRVWIARPRFFEIKNRGDTQKKLFLSKEYSDWHSCKIKMFSKLIFDKTCVRIFYILW